LEDYVSNETAGPAAPARPAPPAEAPPAGTHWAARPANPKAWRLASVIPGRDDTGTCRWRGSGDLRACGDKAVIELRRGIKRVAWWRYCQKHAYGRWAEESSSGKMTVMEYAAVPGEEEPT
jgi:hypothetical protein